MSHLTCHIRRSPFAINSPTTATNTAAPTTNSPCIRSSSLGGIALRAFAQIGSAWENLGCCNSRSKWGLLPRAIQASGASRVIDGLETAARRSIGLVIELGTMWNRYQLESKVLDSAQQGNPDQMRSLLDSGPIADFIRGAAVHDVLRTLMYENGNFASSQRRTSYSNHVETIRLLLENGSISDYDRNIAIEMAVGKNPEPILFRIYIARRSGPMPPRTIPQTTAFYPEIITLLLATGTDSFLMSNPRGLDAIEKAAAQATKFGPIPFSKDTDRVLAAIQATKYKLKNSLGAILFKSPIYSKELARAFATRNEKKRYQAILEILQSELARLTRDSAIANPAAPAIPNSAAPAIQAQNLEP